MPHLAERLETAPGKRVAAIKLLVVEDEARIASFLVKGLAAQGYAVEHVTTGTEAVAAAGDRDLDLIILDLGLPDIDGLEVLRRIRRASEEVPVIVLSARAAVPERIGGLDAGADDYLTKPFSFGELSARVRARLRGRG